MKFIEIYKSFCRLVFKYIKSTLDAYMQNKDEAKETTILQRMLMDERLNVPGAMVAVADLIMAGIDTVSYFYHGCYYVNYQYKLELYTFRFLHYLRLVIAS